MWPSGVILFPLAHNYDLMTWGELGLIWMSIHLYQTFHLQKKLSLNAWWLVISALDVPSCGMVVPNAKTSTAGRRAGVVGVGCAFMCEHCVSITKQRIHAMSRVGFDVDCGCHSVPVPFMRLHPMGIRGVSASLFVGYPRLSVGIRGYPRVTSCFVTKLHRLKIPLNTQVRTSFLQKQGLGKGVKHYDFLLSSKPLLYY